MSRNSMNCPNCGAELLANQPVCIECGTRVGGLPSKPAADQSTTKQELVNPPRENDYSTDPMLEEQESPSFTERRKRTPINDTLPTQPVIPKRPKDKRPAIIYARDTQVVPAVPVDKPDEEETAKTNLPMPVWMRKTFTNIQAVLIHIMSPSEDELPPVTEERREQLQRIRTLNVKAILGRSTTKRVAAAESSPHKASKHKKAFAVLTFILILAGLIVVITGVLVIKLLIGK